MTFRIRWRTYGPLASHHEIYHRKSSPRDFDSYFGLCFCIVVSWSLWEFILLCSISPCSRIPTCTAWVGLTFSMKSKVDVKRRSPHFLVQSHHVGISFLTGKLWLSTKASLYLLFLTHHVVYTPPHGGFLLIHNLAWKFDVLTVCRAEREICYRTGETAHVDLRQLLSFHLLLKHNAFRCRLGKPQHGYLSHWERI